MAASEHSFSTKPALLSRFRMEKQSQAAEDSAIRPEDVVFNYTRASDVLNDLTLDVFFNQNSIPSVRTYSSIETFKSGFVSMNEKLFKSVKERQEECLRSSDQKGDAASAVPELKKNYLAVLEKKRVPKRLKRRLRKSAMKYCHSQSIIRLFRSYFILVEYHHRSINSRPQIMDQYLKTIFTVFGSVKREKMLEMLREISSSPKMQGFYHDLYSLWEEEAGNAERHCLFADARL